MSFRLKTVIGIAAIEGFLLLVLVWSSSSTLEESTQKELDKRGATALKLLATTARDDILTKNVATLLDFVRAVVENEGFVYARISGLDDVELASAGDEELLSQVREEDIRASDVDDEVYDLKEVLLESVTPIGLIELGISTAELESIREQSLQRLGLIAGIEMILVAMFSLMLGQYLTRELARLEDAARTVASGALGHQVEVAGTDEIARTIRSFNDMSRRVQDSYHELQQSETLYRSSQQRLDGLVASLLEGVCLIDDQHRLLFANPAAREQLAMLGNSKVEIDSPLRFPDLEPGQVLVPSGRAAFEIECSVDSRQHSFELTTTMVPNQQSEANEWVLVLRDVTIERETQQELQEHERLAAVGQLAAGIAHDFNNILTVIIGYTELTLRSDTLPERVRENMANVLLQGERAADLVRQFLDFSRKVDAQQERIDLSEYIPAAMKLLDKLVPSSIEIKQDVKADGCCIDFNPTKFQQILANLLLNSVDAMPSGGTITIQTRRRDDPVDPAASTLPGDSRVILSIEDSGIGMASEIKDRIFEPFFTTKPVGKGTGLGLSQVYGLVTRNGGEVKVESEPGSGTSVRLLLPASKEDHSEQRANLPRATSISSDDEQLTILVVEDQQEVLETVEWILNTLGYQTLTASNGEQALEVFELHRDVISAVISDVMMPILTGNELAPRLRAEGFEGPLILMSGYFEADGIDLDQRSELIDGFLQKPIRIDDIKEVLTRCLGEDSWDDESFDL
ncbi:MAG: ATP-binding protein [Planctomycetota bacterium]|nr:ATP-binding protein [Planctomycetota bacterium]